MDRNKMRRRLLGNRRGGSGSESFIEETGLIYGYSFRQLLPTATFAIRQRRTNPDTTVSTQDVGFVNGYIDTQSIINFAQGSMTEFDWYDQKSNVIRYAKGQNATSSPKITDASGNLYLINGKIKGNSGFGTTEHFALQHNNPIFPALTHSFHVNQGVNSRNTYMINSYLTTHVIGVMDTTTGGVSGNSGTPTYWKNGVQITPINRNLLRLQLNNSHSQLTVKNINYSEYTYLYRGYNSSSAYRSLEYMQEELHYDASLMTTQQITDLEQNQIDFYL